MMFLLLSVVFGALTTAGFSFANKVMTDLATLTAYILSAGGTVLIALRIKKSQSPDEKPIQMTPFRTSTAWVVVLLSFAIIIALEPIINLIPIPEMFKELLNNLFSKTVPALLTAVIAAPILEELIFRGIILEGLLKNYNPLKAILITNIFFGIAHLNPWQFVGAFIFGIFISWVYMKTRNIFLPVLIHFVNNLVGYLAIYFSSEPPFETSLKGILENDVLYYSLIAVSVIIISVAITFHKKIIPAANISNY